MKLSERKAEKIQPCHKSEMKSETERDPNQWVEAASIR